MVGVFFIKASTHEFMKNQVLADVDSWFYTFEYYGDHSLWNFLFPSNRFFFIWSKLKIMG